MIEAPLPLAVVTINIPDGRGGVYCQAHLEGFVLTSNCEEKIDISGHRPSGKTPVQAVAALRQMLVDLGMHPHFQQPVVLRPYHSPA